MKAKKLKRYELYVPSKLVDVWEIDATSAKEAKRMYYEGKGEGTCSVGPDEKHGRRFTVRLKRQPK
jgi:hypothetical protein